MKSPMVTDLHAIRARLVRLELSERKFAKLLGISQPTLNARLNGYRRVPPGFEAQCVEALDRVGAGGARRRPRRGRRCWRDDP